MQIENGIWVFCVAGGRSPGGLFTCVEKAEQWIQKHGLTGMLTLAPLDEGVFDWAAQNNVIGLKQDKIADKSKDPFFIGGFSTAAQEHYHYESGRRV
jgi:hypothetical protein